MALTNKVQEALEQVQAKEALKASTKELLKGERRRRTRVFRHPAVRGTLAAACMALFLILGIGGYSWVQTPVSYVSIDVNPSIELALNRLDRVVSATAYNSEGAEILKELSLKGKRYDVAIDTIVESAAMKPYLAGRDALVFTVASEENREQGILMQAEHCMRHAGYVSTGVSADLALVSAAHDSGLSLGKYYAYLQLSVYDETVTPDSCKDMSMSEIHGMIEEHQHGGGHSEEGNGWHHGRPAMPEESYEQKEPKGHHGRGCHHE
ncbi:MAG: hypothetical protein HFI42_12450 [Lachnospiraceae bacterium]|nr:hypothetical protein [Lachnospiraceae bacterium]MCI9151281.1 hypothetical protein [Lachnospiraceae bacterium]